MTNYCEHHTPESNYCALKRDYCDGTLGADWELLALFQKTWGNDAQPPGGVILHKGKRYVSRFDLVNGPNVKPPLGDPEAALAKARTEGAQAFKDGLHIDTNIYFSGTPEAAAWSQGHREAENE